jgi:hypothetical protein
VPMQPMIPVPPQTRLFQPRLLPSLAGERLIGYPGRNSGQSALSMDAWESGGGWGDRFTNTGALDQVFASFQDNGKRKWAMV